MATFTVSELSAQALQLYVGYTYEVLLLYNQNTPLGGDTTYADITSIELSTAFGGYQRLTYTYAANDIVEFGGSVFMDEKQAIFVHNDDSSELSFDHIAVVRVDGSTRTLVVIESLGETATLSAGQTATANIKLVHGVP